MNGGTVIQRSERAPGAEASDLVIAIGDWHVRLRVEIDETSEGRRFTWTVKSWLATREEP